MNKSELLKQAIHEKWTVCTYGLGYLGKRLYKEIPDMFGLKALFFSDSDDNKVDKISLPDISPIHRAELLETADKTIVFILVDDPYDLEIEKDLSVNSNILTVSLRELALMSDVIYKFYGDDIYSKYIKLSDMREM